MLINAVTEILFQYVALRNINLVVQKRPEILKHEIKAFFVKYNDPIYVKLEKLDIMIRLSAQANIAQVIGIHTLLLRFPILTVEATFCMEACFVYVCGKYFV